MHETQAGLYAQLAAASALTSQLHSGADSIFDHVPAGSPMPYIVITSMATRSIDTQNISGNDMTAVIECYSRADGFRETQDILAALYDALHNANFAITGHTLILCQHIDTDVSREGDGLTRRGTSRFRLITEPT